MSKKRVLLAPRNISGQATEYLAAVRPLGVDGEVWSYGETAFGFPADVIVDQDRFLADPRYRWGLFDRAVRSFDTFHLQYGRSLLTGDGVGLPDLWDLPLLRSLGKRVIMNFRGSDVRSPARHVGSEPHSYFKTSTPSVSEERIQVRLSICRRYCDTLLVSTPGLLDDVPDARWLPHVIDAPAWRTDRGEEPDTPVVAHIPSSRSTKGSEHVDAAMRTLADAGVILYRPLIGLTRPQLRTAIQSSDVLVDSLTIGDHGLISVEAMAAGAVAVAHIADENRRRNPGVPVVEATPDSIGQVVRSLAADPGRRAALRLEGVRFVRDRHDRPAVAPQLLDVYQHPRQPVGRGYPEWPREPVPRRIAQLEARVDELEADVDPLVRGFGDGYFSKDLPGWAIERLLREITALEEETASLRAAQGLAPRAPHGRRPRPRRRGLRDVLKDNPTVHRAVRTARRRLVRGG